MTDERKTKAQLIREMGILRADLRKLEKREQQRERVEGALRESAEQYRLLFENSGDAVLFAQPDGTIHSANPEACRMFGRTEKEIRKLGRAGIVDTSDPRLTAALEERRNTSKFRGELNLLRRDGTVFPADISTVVFKDSQGIERTSMLIRDMTSRKQRKEEQAYETRLHKFRSEMSHSINRQLSLGEMLQQSAEIITRILDIACAHVWIVNRETHSVELQGHAELSTLGADTDACIHIANLVAGKVVAEGQMIRSNSVLDGRSLIDASWARHHNIVAYAGLPLLVENQIVGVLTVFASTLLLEPTLSPLAGSVVTLAQGIMRKKAEESVALLAHTIRSIGECVSITDTDNKILFVNEAFLRTYGYTADELIGKPITVVRPPRSEPAAEKVLPATLEGGWQGELVNRKKDGTEFPIALSTSVVRNEKGQSIALVGIAADITERKRAEDALRVSLEKYRVLFESFPLGITISDKSGKIMEVNRQSEKLLGITSEVLAQRSIDSKEWQIIRKDGTRMPADEYASARALRENRLIENVEMGIVKDKGEITWISVTAAPIPLEGYGVAIAYGDVTERKQAEEQVQILSRFPAENPNPVMRIASDGVILYANDASGPLLAMWNIQTGQLMPDDWRTQIAEVSKSGQRKEIEVRCGQRVFSCILASILGAGYVNVYGRDVTERKQTEARVKQALEWQEAIFEGSRDAIFISDQDSRFVAVNNAACDLTGYSREQLLKMRIPDLHDHPDLDAYKTFHQRIFDGENILSEAKILRNDGRKVDTEFNNRRVSIAGKPYMHTTARNITERKRAEEALIESERKLKTLFEILPVGASVLDAERNVVYVNSALERI
ncbi:MAG: PAS domain S-box protein, partial [Ignavibacteriales bacterium]|nr:PAS domain S-box protein [Ignavibacteriales bacterium]